MQTRSSWPARAFATCVPAVVTSRASDWQRAGPWPAASCCRVPAAGCAERPSSWPAASFLHALPRACQQWAGCQCVGILARQQWVARKDPSLLRLPVFARVTTCAPTVFLRPTTAGCKSCQLWASDLRASCGWHANTQLVAFRRLFLVRVLSRRRLI